jgi:hypothetical protein
MAAAMFPDIIDKPVRWILNWVPNDRIPAHTGAAWLLTTVLARAHLGRRFARGWTVGYGAHLLADQMNAYLNPGRLYFWWPLKRYTMHTGPTGLKSSLADFRPASLAIEGALTALGLGVWMCERAHRASVRRHPPDHRRATVRVLLRTET